MNYCVTCCFNVVPGEGQECGSCEVRRSATPPEPGPYTKLFDALQNHGAPTYTPLLSMAPGVTEAQAAELLTELRAKYPHAKAGKLPLGGRQYTRDEISSAVTEAADMVDRGLTPAELAAEVLANRSLASGYPAALQTGVPNVPPGKKSYLDEYVGGGCPVPPDFAPVSTSDALRDKFLRAEVKLAYERGYRDGRMAAGAPPVYPWAGESPIAGMANSLAVQQMMEKTFGGGYHDLPGGTVTGGPDDDDTDDTDVYTDPDEPVILG